MKIADSKKWLLFVTLLLICMVLFIGGINYVVDPYGINHFFKQKNFNFYKKSNTGYTFRVKTHAYKAKKFDNLMLGTSRVGVMNPKVVDELLGGKTFNFSSPGSITEIHKDLFFYALNDRNITNVIYGIDFLSLNGSLRLKNDFEEFFRVKDKIKRNQTIYNFDLYYNFKTLEDSFEIVKCNFTGDAPREKRYLYQNGMRDYINYIDKDLKGTYAVEKEMHHNIRSYFHPDRTGGYQNYTFSYKYLSYIQEIVTYCKKHNIKLWIYIPPMHENHFDALKAYGIYEDFELFKRELVKISNYVDFTGHNYLTTDKACFWDGSHLKSEYSALIMKEVLTKDKINNSNHLGTYVNKNNIEEHLTLLANEIKVFNMDALLKSKE